MALFAVIPLATNHAGATAITNNFFFLDNRVHDIVFNLNGEYVQIEADVFDPLGIPGNIASVWATNTSTGHSYSLRFSPAAAPSTPTSAPYIFAPPASSLPAGDQQSNYSITVANRQGVITETLTHTLSASLQLPAPSNVRINTSTPVTPIVSFDPVPGATGYDLRVFDSSRRRLIQLNSALPSFQLPSGLLASERTYSFGLQALDVGASGLNRRSNYFLSYSPLTLGDYVRSIVAPAIHWTPGSITMAATFSPKAMTLTEAAQLGGYDHFNWYQIAQEYPGSSLSGHPAPFVDPPMDLFGLPIGGLGVQRADGLPFYWDETHCFECESKYYLYDPSNTSVDDKTLSFEDLPMDIYIPLLGDKMSFTTQLVGIRSDGTWDALSTFNWSSDYHCGLIDCTGGLLGSRNLDPFPVGGIGGVFNAYEVADLRDLPIHVRELMVRDGATNVPLSNVAEPSTIFLLGNSVLFGVLIHLKRRRSNVVRN
jgi:hypothetical protein